MLIFEGEWSRLLDIVVSCMKAFSETGVTFPSSAYLVLMPRVPKDLSVVHDQVGFFDGASHDSANICGVSDLLRLADNIFFKLWMNYGFGTY